MNTLDQEIHEGRLAYERPAMTHVVLRPAEAVLGACKTASTATGVSETNSCALDNCTIAAS